MSSRPFKMSCALVVLIGAIVLPMPCRSDQHFNVTSQVYIDFELEGQPVGRTIIGLFGDVAPRTVANFRALCIDGIDGHRYAGAPMHRIIDKFMVQGGDVVTGDGRGSLSLYGKYFEDEHLKINHTGPGFLAMANKGPNTNGCQFYITTLAAPWLDGKHTIFGKVVSGQGYVHAIEKVRTDTDDFPVKTVRIAECGDVPTSEPFTVSDNNYDMTGWLTASVIPLGMSFTILGIFQMIIRKLDQFIKVKEE